MRLPMSSRYLSSPRRSTRQRQRLTHMLFINETDEDLPPVAVTVMVPSLAAAYLVIRVNHA